MSYSYHAKPFLFFYITPEFYSQKSFSDGYRSIARASSEQSGILYGRVPFRPTANELNVPTQSLSDRLFGVAGHLDRLARADTVLSHLPNVEYLQRI